MEGSRCREGQTPALQPASDASRKCRAATKSDAQEFFALKSLLEGGEKNNAKPAR